MLDTSRWRLFQVQDLFDISYGINMELNACTLADDEIDSVNFVGRAEDNNGVTAKVKRVDGKEPQPAGIITCAGGGSVLSTFLQTEPFYSGRDLYLLQSKEEISISAKLFFITVLKANKYRYNYGRQANKTLPYIEVSLPVASDGKPDWAWMEAFMSQYYQGPLQSQNQSSGKPLSVDTWAEFRVGSLFDVKKGKRLTSEDQTEGDNLYIGAIDSNNGVAAHIGQLPIHDGNTISLSYNGSIGEAFYQPDPFWATDDVNVLYLKPEYGFRMNTFVGLFFCTILRQEKYRYAYGRKWTLDSMRDTVIKLPATTDTKGNTIPDWAWMEQYMRSLPYSDLLEQR